MGECVTCSRPAHSALLCQQCTDDLARDLRDVPDLATELDTTRYRRDRIGGARVGSRSAETPLAWKEPAADAAWVLTNTLTTWARDLAETHRATLDADTVAAIATWLGHRLDWLRQHPAVDEAHDEITAAVRNARRAIDRPIDLPYAGRCQACAEHMYARMDRPLVTCRACGHEHDTQALRDSLLDAVAHKTLTAPELAAALPALLEAPLPLATIKGWIRQRWLFRAGRNHKGHATYRIHDVLVLAANRTRRNIAA